MSLHPPAELEARIRGLVAKEPATRTPVRSRLLLAGVAILAAVAIGLGIARTRSMADYPTAFVVATTGVATLLALLGAFAAASPGRRGLGAPITTLLAIAIGVPLVYAATMAIVPMEPLHPPAGDVNHGALTCFFFSVAVAGVGLLALVAALRRSVPVAPFARGAALGAAAGAWAGLAVHLHCPAFDRMHILLGHVAPIVLFALLGGVLARRIIRP